MLAIASTTACGTDPVSTAVPAGSAPSVASSAPVAGGAPPPGTEAPAAGTKSKEQVCKEAEVVAKPFFDTYVNNAPTVKAGQPLPADYVDGVHKTATTFAGQLHALASESADAAIRTAFEEYASKVDTDIVASPDLSAVTPENSGWLLSLGKLC
ncbi:MAG: hypothetical protein QOH97_5613 [Actinoplanes sp.]|jgi:hypothetical protein|nr:hypothetical protein [Actinoplanes sp.]